MTKSRIKSLSIRSLSTLLALLVMFSTLLIGGVTSTSAASASITVYFQDNYNWGTVYAFSGSNMTVRNNGGYGYDVYGSGLNSGWVTMTKVLGTSNIYKATMTVYDGKVAFAKAKSDQGGYFNNCNQCAVTPSGMTNGKLLNIWTGSSDEVSYMNGISYRKYDLQDYTPPVPHITGYNSDWNNGDAMTLDSGTSYYFAFDGDSSKKYFRFKFGSTYYEAYEDGFDLEHGTGGPYDGSTSAKKYGSRSGNSNAFELDAVNGYSYRIYFDADSHGIWFTKTGKTYAVTLNKNSGTGGSNSVTATFGSAMPSATMPTRDGYDFAGYYDTSATSGGTQYYTAAGASANVWDKTSATTLYARWTAKTYTVTLNKNSGSGGSDSVTATYDAAMPSATMPTRDGYDFVGYYDTSATSGGTQYYTAAGASARSWNKTSDTTLYARWSIKTYTVSYNKGTNGTGTNTTDTKTHGTALDLRGAIFTRDGYTQTGWNTDSSGSGGTHYNLSDSYTNNEAVTLYPEWTINRYAITLSESVATGGTLTVDGSAFSSGDTVTHGNHTFRLDAPAGYDIDSISGIGTWSKNTSYATLSSTSITSAKTITVTYKISPIPALRVNYTSASGAATASSGSVTTTTRYNVTLTFTNQTAMDNGTSYTVTEKIGSAAATTIKTGTTSSTGGEITVKSAGTLSAGTHVFTITANGNSSSVTVVVNQSRTLTVSSVSHTSVSGTYTDEFGRASQSISSAGTYYGNNGGAYSITYTADTGYRFDGNNTTTTKTYSGTFSGNVTTTPTISEQEYTLTLNKAVADSTTKVDDYTVKPITGANITAPSETYYSLSNYTVTSGSVVVNGTTYSASGTSTIPAGNLTAVKASGNVTIRANFAENSYTLTIERWKIGASSRTSYTTQTLYPVTQSTVAPGTISGYTHDYWKVNSGTVKIGSSSYTSSSGNIETKGSLSNVTLNDNATIRAYFKEDTHTITVASAKQNNVALGTVSPASGSVGTDTTLSISATAKTGYEFTGWTKSPDNNTVTIGSSSSANTTVKATVDNATVTADFKANVIYLDTSKVISDGHKWTHDSAKIKAVFGSSYLDMSAVDGVTDMWQIAIPSGFTIGTDTIKFQRCDPSGNTQWNITESISTAAKQNLYKITGWDSAAIQDTPYFPPQTYSVTVNVNDDDMGYVAESPVSVVDDQGSTYTTLPAPTANYGYKFVNWTVTSGVVKTSAGTYEAGATPVQFSTSETAAIQVINAGTVVQANFTYDDEMNLYLTGRFRVYDKLPGSANRNATYVGGSQGAWNPTATNIPFSYNAENHCYYLNTFSTLAEVSANVGGQQFYRIYDGENTIQYQLSGSDQALTTSDEGVRYTMGTSGDKGFYFNEASNNNGPVTIWFDPFTAQTWYSIPPRHEVSVGTISRTVRDTTTSDKLGGTVTVNDNVSAQVSEGINYTIKVSPVTGYKITALAVNGVDILTGSGHENKQTEFTMTHAMALNKNDSYTEVITATFTAIQYTVTVAKNSTNSNNTIGFKVNSSSTVVSSDSTLTVADKITPVASAHTANGYELDHIIFTTSSQTPSAISGYSNVANNTQKNMLAQSFCIYAYFKATTPTVTASNLNNIIAGQPINSGATTNTWASLSNFVLKTTGGTTLDTKTTDGAITAPTTGIDRTSGTDFKLTITSTNYKSDISGATYNTKTADKIITVHVSYSATQLAYLDLVDKYNEIDAYEIGEGDIESGWTAFNTAMQNAESAKDNGLPAWDADNTSYYNGLKTALQTAYNGLVFKENTVYVLTKYPSDNQNYVNIFVFKNRDGDANTEPDPIFESDSALSGSRISNDNRNHHMTYEGQTNSGKYLYSFKFRGHQEFIVYWQNDSTSTFDPNKKLTGDVDLREAAYGSYYVDIKDQNAASGASTTAYTAFTQFGISADGADSDFMAAQCKEGDEGYSVAQVQEWLNVSYSGSLAATSSQEVLQSYEITGPIGRSESSTVTVDETNRWIPLKPGRYNVTFTASVGTDNRANAGAVFSGGKTETDDAQTLTLFVAFDEIEIYADMNGNVGTPTMHFTYIDSTTEEPTDLPCEFDMVTGSESIYSYTLSVSDLKESYNLDLIGDGCLTISKISIDSDDVANSSFEISKSAARTGTLWLKADSTNMKTFHKIAYGSSTRTFKAVLREDLTSTTYKDTPFNNSFAEVSGTGIITDEPVDYSANESFSGNGSRTSFVLTTDADVSGIRRITIGGEVQDSDKYSYNAETKTVTFTFAPASGTDNIVITYTYKSYDYTSFYAAKDITPDTTVMSGDGTEREFTLTGAGQIVRITSVKVDGTETNAYSYNNTTRKITFTSAPSSGTNNIVINYDYKYDFSYKIHASAETDIIHKVGDTTSYYYFDHWEKNGAAVTDVASGTDINIMSAPNYSNDADVTYVAVYKLTDTQKRVKITYNFKDYNTDDENYVFDETLNADETDYLNIKDASYTKIVNWNGTDSYGDLADDNAPVIKSNYFDYKVDKTSARETASEDNNTKITCVSVTMTHKAHKYKIVYNGDTHIGYYQQSKDLSTTGSNVRWYINGADGSKIVIGTGDTFTAKFGMYQGSGTEDGYDYDTYEVHTDTSGGSTDKTTNIITAHQEVFPDGNTEKARHNFYIIDTTANDNTFVGGGVVYATADGNGYRQPAAAANLANTASIRSYIGGILSSKAKLDTEFKAQTINNTGFRYLPYENGKDVFRYSDVLGAYQYMFAGENTNSPSLGDQTLRVFSFFVYTSTSATANTILSEGGVYYNVVVSSTYAETSRYIDTDED